MKTETFELWPTRVLSLEAEDASEHNARIIEIALSRSEGRVRESDETRAYDIHLIDDPSIEWLVSEFKKAAELYVGFEVGPVTARAVVMGHGSFIGTHTESTESDLMLAYWPQGDAGPTNSWSNPNVAPRFMLQDPSRHLTDRRFPHEINHSIPICPRPGLMLVGPGHLPHFFHPYLGSEPFVHVVAQTRVLWPEQYKLRW